MFLFVSYRFHLALYQARIRRFIFLTIAYFLIILLLFEGIVRLHQFLRDRNIYLQFGHADEILVEIFFLWVILAFINIGIIIIRKNKK